MMSTMYFQRGRDASVLESTSPSEKTMDSSTTTVAPASTSRSLQSVSPDECGRLIIVVDGISYAWFDLTPAAIEDVSIDLFRQRIDDFFGMPYDNQVISDQDGPIETTTDLRRSLRCTMPSISVERADTVKPIHASPPRSASPEPHALPPIRLTLTKRTSSDFFGFSNVVTHETEGLTITRIDPHGLLFRTRYPVGVGDVIVSVNGESRIAEMRRELLVSASVVLDIQQSPLLTVYPACLVHLNTV